ncbi:MAG: hypothetical protein RL120_10865 [Gammaproteobacteria bacterium]
MAQSLELQLVEVFELVKRNFVFIADASLEQWDMPPRFYDGRQRIRDDCDGFCLACRSLLRRRNIASRLVYCELEERNRRYGHLVVELQGWIVDNRKRRVLPNSRFYDSQWRYISGFEPGDPWKEIVSQPGMA